MNSKQIIWAPSAEADLKGVLFYLQNRWSEQVIAKFISKVEDAIELIVTKPKTFPFINKELQLRKCVITKHNTLFYRELHHKIEIVRLFDSRQDPQKLKF